MEWQRIEESPPPWHSFDVLWLSDGKQVELATYCSILGVKSAEVFDRDGTAEYLPFPPLFWAFARPKPPAS